MIKVEYVSNHWSDFPQISNCESGDQIRIKGHEVKPLIGSSLNLKHRLRGPHQNWKYLERKLTSNGRWPCLWSNMMSRQIESSQGEIKGNLRGKLRGNLECGSAQPSLFFFWVFHRKFCHIWLTVNCLSKTNISNGQQLSLVISS